MIRPTILGDHCPYRETSTVLARPTVALDRHLAMNHPSRALAILGLVMVIVTVSSVGVLHDRGDPLVAVYDNAVSDDLMEVLRSNFKTMQSKGHLDRDKRAGQTVKAWFNWPPRANSTKDDILVTWIRYLIQTVPELAENGPYVAVDYWLQDHLHSRPMWFHYDLGMSVDNGEAMHPTFSALVYLQDGAPVMMFPHTMNCLKPFGELMGCLSEDMVRKDGYEYDRPMEQDGATVAGFNAIKEAYVVKAKAGSIMVFDGALMHGPLPQVECASGVTGLKRELLGIHFWKAKPGFGGLTRYKPGSIRFGPRGGKKKAIEGRIFVPPTLTKREVEVPYLRRSKKPEGAEEVKVIVKKSPLTQPGEVNLLTLEVDLNRLAGCDFCHASDAILRIGPDVEQVGQSVRAPPAPPHNCRQRDSKLDDSSRATNAELRLSTSGHGSKKQLPENAKRGEKITTKGKLDTNGPRSRKIRETEERTGGVVEEF